MDPHVQVLTRRDRLRAATSQEIIEVARRLLVSEGSSAMSLRAIAREMGMTAPALYRYYPSLEDLVRHVVADIFTELMGELEAAVSAGGATGSDSEESGSAHTEPTVRSTTLGLITACRAFRAWAIAHPAEFGLLFGTPLPGIVFEQPDSHLNCGMSFGAVFLGLITDLWRIKAFDVPSDDEIDPVLLPQLASYRDTLGTDLPAGVLQTFLHCWVLLYGTVTLEVFGHMKFALDNPAPMFELMLGDLAAMIGLTYPLPG